MTRHRYLHKRRSGIRRIGQMGARIPTAAGSRATADHTYHSLPQNVVNLESPFHRNINSSSSISPEQRRFISAQDQCQNASNSGVHRDRSWSFSSCSTQTTQDIPEQLAELLVTMFPGTRGQEMGEAFRLATDLPPITKQSLSELDIEHIITNIRLRHDVSFDRDLSFRPNFDGSKGQAKRETASRYWKSLAAELELYVRLFQGSPSLANSANWSEIVQHAERRMPIMFRTIKDVLKSLVPERDYSRVDENLDVPKLMQEIERGVCDFVRLAEWMAQLLKEHCAPMRDVLVDEMVAHMRTGAAENKSEEIVHGLCQLMGILEAMKLVDFLYPLIEEDADLCQDVANHQIRNLKTLLIEDTINFERQYHLEKLVNNRARINIELAHQWYEAALTRYGASDRLMSSDTAKLHLNVFIKAVVSTLFSESASQTLPETFYLDQDRLRAIRYELDDLIYFEICFEVFGQLVRNLGYTRPIPQASRQVLQTALSAIIGDGANCGPSPWMMTSENIALELVRQAHKLCGRNSNYDSDILNVANQHLRVMFSSRFRIHAAALESYITTAVLNTINGNMQSAPMDLFNKLVSDPTQIASPLAIAQQSTSQGTATEASILRADHFADISNRLSHIILLHWRIWGPIAYIYEDEATSASTATVAEGNHTSTSATTTPAPLTHHSSLSAPPVEATTTIHQSLPP